MPTNIFIDTSTYLSFYAVSNDDLQQLEKLVGLIADGQVKLLVTAQVQREWSRNRDNKLAEAINNVEKFNLKAPSIPRFMWEYVEVAELLKAMAAAEKARSGAVIKAKLEAGTATTNADKLIQRIFYAAGIEADNAEVFARAERRMAIGDLPGKPGSLGDRLNWEHLLASDLTDGDLHIISRDGDYFSPVDAKVPKYALLREWIEKKNGKLHVHDQIKPFLSSKFPQFHFKPEPKSRAKSADQTNADLSRAHGARDRWTALKNGAIDALERAVDAPSLELAVQDLERLLPYLGEADLLKMCKIAINSDVFHDFLKEDYIYIFFENLIPKIFHLLDRKDIEALEVTFSLDLHPDEFQENDDPLVSDYGQAYLDLLEEEVDRDAQTNKFSSRRSDVKNLRPDDEDDLPF